MTPPNPGVGQHPASSNATDERPDEMLADETPDDETPDDETPHAATAERTALKEWAVLVDAMARGDVIAMVRKGGIREQRAGFKVRHDRFVLYPTYFHEKAAELAERFLPTLEAAHVRRPAAGRIRIELVASVAAVWPVSDLALLAPIAGEHGLNAAAVAARFHYKGRPGVQVVAVRVARLHEPVELDDLPRYAGCVSWIALDDALAVAGAEPVLDDATFARRLRALHAALGAPDPPG